MVKFDGDTAWTVYNRTNSELPKDFIYAVVVDSKNNKSIGTWKGGLAMLNEKGLD